MAPRPSRASRPFHFTVEKLQALMVILLFETILQPHVVWHEDMTAVITLKTLLCRTKSKLFSDHQSLDIQQWFELACWFPSHLHIPPWLSFSTRPAYQTRTPDSTTGSGVLIVSPSAHSRFDPGLSSSALSSSSNFTTPSGRATEKFSKRFLATSHYPPMSQRMS